MVITSIRIDPSHANNIPVSTGFNLFFASTPTAVWSEYNSIFLFFDLTKQQTKSIVNM